MEAVKLKLTKKWEETEIPPETKLKFAGRILLVSSFALIINLLGLSSTLLIGVVLV
jgi:hypothetical protein